jgi:hypothetical protein
MPGTMKILTGWDDMFDDLAEDPFLQWDLPAFTEREHARKVVIEWGGKRFEFASEAEARKHRFYV